MLATVMFALLLSVNAFALNELPAKWRYLGIASPFDPRTGFGSCMEAGESALAEARAFWAPRVINESTVSRPCPPPPAALESGFTIWSYRLADDFPTSPNKDIAITGYCDPGYFPTVHSSQVMICTPESTPITKSIGFCRSCPVVGNPIYPSSANKVQVETDYVGSGAFPLKFERVYNSAIWGSPVSAARLGSSWWHSYYRKLVLGPTPSDIIFVGANRPDGRVFAFKKTGSVFVADPDVVGRLEQIPGGWKLTNEGDEVEIYDSNGKLLSISNRAGLSHTLTYFTSGSKTGQIDRITDSFGRTLAFEYDSRLRISAMVDPSGGRYSYGYNDAFNGLVGITYPDTSSRTYHYENAGNRSLLTGITDENGQRFATFGYDGGFQPVLSEHAGGAGRESVGYIDGLTKSVTTFVNASLSATRTYTYQNVQGVLLHTTISNPACPECGPPFRTYDANGNVLIEGNWRAFRTRYDSYDLARNLETKRTEGLASNNSVIANVTRTITTQWHPDYRLQTGVAEPFRITAMAYGGPSDPNPGNRGSLLSRTLQPTADADGAQGFGASASGTPRTWTYTYNANGSVLTMDGPRTDAPDVTTYTYYANDATCPGASAIGCRGQVESIANASGHVTRITEYNAHGQPLTIVDPNGLNTALTYDQRQRLTSRNVGGEATTYTYDSAGQLTRVTLPDNSYLQYTYDAAHRLTQIADQLGNRITYTLDFAGNRTQEQVFDPLNQLAQTRSRVYNNQNRLIQEIGAAGQNTAFAYSGTGRVQSIDGPLPGTVDLTNNLYDPFDRLTRVTDPNAGQVNYGYNRLDQLTSVTDPRGLVTSYSYDGLNNLNQLVSPDTGSTVNTYDLAGNLLTQTDAKGQLTTYSYDALNRVVQITFHDGSKQTYSYDQGVNGLGRLTGITELGSGNVVTSQLAYSYDSQGRITAETRIINGITYVTGYSYDFGGRLSSMTYPSGRSIVYTLDSLGRIAQIEAIKDNVSQIVLTGATYRPFGPAQSYTFGNGQLYTRGFDTDARIASYTLGTQSFAVGYDPASRIGFISDLANPANTNTYGYDNLDRLTGAVLPATPYAYSYDAVGNRLSKTVGASTDIYTPSATSNRLASIAPGTGPLKGYVHDAVGSVTADGTNTYAYDARGRLVQAVSVMGTSNYQINSLGQRIRKTNSQGDTVFHYDSQGRLIAESSPSGTTHKEYIYLGDLPVAVLQ
jgi:YD repeat-containing protein